MDGTFAVLTFALGLLDMSQNHCATACLGPTRFEPRTNLSMGAVQYQEEHVSEELYLRQDTGRGFGPFQMSYGLSVTTEGDAWAGIGSLYTHEFAGGGAYVQLHAMPGLYMAGSGPDLGGAVEFRSGIELGVQTRGGVRFGLSYDHRSNAGLYEENPGLETVQFRVSIPTR